MTDATAIAPALAANITRHLREVPIRSIDPNPWNPNEQSEREVEAERESLVRFGFIDDAHVRLNPDDPSRYQMLDGEHRLKLMRSFLDNGVPAEAHPQLHDLIAREVMPVVELENLSDADAKKLTLILNGGGKNNSVKLAQLLSEVREEVGADETLVGLPYTEAELNDYGKLGDFDWDSIKQDAAQSTEGTASEGGQGSGDGKGKDGFVRFTAAMADDQYELFQQVYDLVKEQLESDGKLLHERKDLALGQVLEAMAADYLAMPGYRKSEDDAQDQDNEGTSGEDWDS